MVVSRLFEPLLNSFRSPKKSPRSPRRRPLGLETLEERAVPVVGLLAMTTEVEPGTGYDGVVRVGGATGSLLWTGRHVLTAGHVVADGQGNVVASTTVRFDLPDTTVTMQVTSDHIFFPTLFNGNINVGHDLAILELPALAPSGPQGVGAERYDIYRNFNEIGQGYSVVGYGRTGTGITGELPGTGGTKRFGINFFGDDATGRNTAGTLGLVADFDDGTVVFDTLGDGLGYGVAESATGSGDSGAPAFLGGLIAAVNSRTTNGLDGLKNSYGDVDLFTRVSRFAGFIDATVDDPYELVLDMSLQSKGGDGNGDTIEVKRNGFTLEIVVNNQLYHSVPLTQLTGVRIFGSSDSEDFYVHGDLTHDVTFDGRGGNNTVIVVGSTQNDQMTVGSNGQVTVSAPILGTMTITSSNADALMLLGVGGSDKFIFQGSLPAIDVHVNGGSGSNTLIRQTGGTAVWDVTDSNTGTLAGKVSFVLVQNLTGANTNDVFRFANGAGVSGTIDGKSGNDRLDYSACVTKVTVDLASGAATGAGAVLSIGEVIGGSAGDELYGGAGNDFLRGGGGGDTIDGRGGADLLMGDAGGDSLMGGDGRDLLVGGDGSDWLFGEGDDDVLIGGTTDYDNAPSILTGLLGLWNGAGSYQARIDLLREQGYVGSFHLDADRVNSDSDLDRMFGGAGEDWFWTDFADWLFDKAASEKVR